MLACPATGFVSPFPSAAAAAELAAGRAIGEGPAPRYVTAALRVDYLKPTPLGMELEVRAHVTERSDRKTSVAVSIAANGIVTVRAEAVAAPLPKTMLRPIR